MSQKGNNQKDFDQLNRKIDELVTSNSQLVSQDLDFFNQINGSKKESRAQYKEFSKAIRELKSIILEKDAEIAKPKEQLNKDSTNSRNGKGAVKRPKSGQKGHPGKTIELMDEPDAIELLVPKDCEGCTLFGTCETVVASSRNIIDLINQMVQTRYNQGQCKCAMQGGAIIKEKYPAGVNSFFQYCNTIQSMVVSLSAFGMVSMCRITETINALTGLSMSDATVNNMILSSSDKFKKQLPELRKMLLESYSIGFDETGICVGVKNHRMHTASIKDLTLLVSSSKRGKPGIDECGVLPHFKGVAVHDCWSSCYNEDYAGATHALCCAHIDRELQGVNDDYKQRWSKQMKKLLMSMCVNKAKLLDKGIDKAPDAIIREFSGQYDRIVASGIKGNPIPKVVKWTRGRPKKGTVRSLLDTLLKLKTDVMRFFTDFRVPYSNNIAEKSYRLSKKKMQIAGMFRASDGEERFATIFVIIDTCRKKGINLIDALSRFFAGTFSFVFLNQSVR